MPEPTRTPNPATATRPERSSERVAHKKTPLAWLPLALLALLVLLALLIYLLVRGASGSDNTAKAGAVPAAPTAPTTPTAPSAPAAGPGAGSAGAETPGGGAGGAAAAGSAGAPINTSGALVGGAGLAPAAATNIAGSGGGAKVAAAAPGTAGTVLFAEGKASIDADGRQVVTTAAKNLTAGGAKNVQVIGYTDRVAGTPVNGPLSQQRAQAVAAELKALLPAGTTITTSAKGEADPAASNTTAAGRQQNRRVAILGTS